MHPPVSDRGELEVSLVGSLWESLWESLGLGLSVLVVLVEGAESEKDIPER